MSPGQPSERSCRQLLLFFSSDSFLLFLEICRLECDQDSLRNGPVNSYYFFSSDCFLLFLEICRLECDQDSLRNGPVDSYYFFFHQTASCFIWRSAAGNIGRTALGTILSIVVLFVHQMCHDHDAHVFSTTVSSEKARKIMSETTRQIMPEHLMEKRQKRGKKGHAWTKRHRGQENGRNRRLWIPQRPKNGSHNRSQIVFAFVGMEQSSVPAWWIIRNSLQADR